MRNNKTDSKGSEQLSKKHVQSEACQTQDYNYEQERRHQSLGGISLQDIESGEVESDSDVSDEEFTATNDNESDDSPLLSSPPH